MERGTKSGHRASVCRGKAGAAAGSGWRSRPAKRSNSSSQPSQRIRKRPRTQPRTFRLSWLLRAIPDPVATGLVTSLARPGGHVTGLSQMTPDLSGKRLELLKEIVPNVSAVALLFNPEDPLSVLDRQEAERSAQALGIKTHSRSVRNAADLDSALHEALASRA